MDHFNISGQMWFDGVHDPVLWVKENKIAYCNPAAKEVGFVEEQLLPEELQGSDGEQVFCVRWQGVSWNCRKEQMQEGDLIQLSCSQTKSISLKRINQMVGRMRLPLSNLYSTMQMLMNPSVEQNEEKFRMYQGIQRKNYYMLHRMLENTELLCWLEDESSAFQMQMLDFGGLCETVVHELEALFEQANCSITIDHKDANLLVKGNDWALRHMLYELLSNALRFAPKQGRVWMKVGREGRRVRVLIGNSGDGFSSEEMANAFDPATASDELTPGKGLGIGISICRLIVERQGGRIALLSGKGGTVVVELPLCEYLDGGQLHSPEADRSGGISSALLQLSDALPWECFLDDER